MKKVIQLLLLLFMVSVPFITIQAIDQLGGLEETAQAARINQSPTNPEAAVTQIIQWVLSFVGVLFLGLMIFGGFTWMTSGGNKENIDKARKTVVSAAIGLIIILSAYAITVYIGGILNNSALN